VGTSHKALERLALRHCVFTAGGERVKQEIETQIQMQGCPYITGFTVQYFDISSQLVVITVHVPLFFLRLMQN
jgi:hypothetical protein